MLIFIQRPTNTHPTSPPHLRTRPPPTSYAPHAAEFSQSPVIEEAEQPYTHLNDHSNESSDHDSSDSDSELDNESVADFENDETDSEFDFEEISEILDVPSDTETLAQVLRKAQEYLASVGEKRGATRGVKGTYAGTKVNGTSSATTEWRRRKEKEAKAKTVLKADSQFLQTGRATLINHFFKKLSGSLTPVIHNVEVISISNDSDGNKD